LFFELLHRPAQEGGLLAEIGAAAADGEVHAQSHPLREAELPVEALGSELCGLPAG
jgi:hypothetical protein